MEDECLYVGGEWKRAASLCVKIFCCFKEAYRAETAFPDISKVKAELSKYGSLVRDITVKRGDRDRFTCNWGHFWHHFKWPGLLSIPLNMSDITSKADKQLSEWTDKWFDLKIMKPLGYTTAISTLYFLLHEKLLVPNDQWNKHQRHSDRCDRCTPCHISTLIRIWSQIITKTVMRSVAYRLHKMELLLLFLPPVQGSRSIWQSGIALRSCSCCSIDVQQLPHRFLLSHELETQIYTVVRIYETAFFKLKYLSPQQQSYKYQDSKWVVCIECLYFLI